MQKTESDVSSISLTTTPEKIKNLKLDGSTFPNSIPIKWDAPLTALNLRYKLTINGNTEKVSDSSFIVGNVLFGYNYPGCMRKKIFLNLPLRRKILNEYYFKLSHSRFSHSEDGRVGISKFFLSFFTLFSTYHDHIISINCYIFSVQYYKLLPFIEKCLYYR